MGVSPEDCFSVAKLVGYKVFLNELFAFSKLGTTSNFRKEIISNNTFELYKNGTLPLPNDLIMVWNVKFCLFCFIN